MRIFSTLATAVLAALVAPALPGQKLSFETASVKANGSGSDGGTMGVRGRRFVATNVPLSALLSFAFSPQGGRLRQEQVVGVPSWGNTDRFDVEAIADDPSAEIPIGRARGMLQVLLEERFSLRFHHETRELPVYDLVLNKRGPKLSEDQTPPAAQGLKVVYSASGQPTAPPERGTARFSTGPGIMTITASAITTSALIDLLQGQTDRMIIDRTELKGLFDVRLEFAPGRVPATESGATSIFTAIQETGFRLDSAKAPVEVLIIDNAQKPSAN